MMDERNMTYTTTIIPAAPGWIVCVPGSDGEGNIDELLPSEVIAWAVRYSTDGRGVSGFACPVVADDSFHEGDNVIMRSPEGRYFRWGTEDFGHDKQAALRDEITRLRARQRTA